MSCRVAKTTACARLRALVLPKPPLPLSVAGYGTLTMTLDPCDEQSPFFFSLPACSAPVGATALFNQAVAFPGSVSKVPDTPGGPFSGLQVTISRRATLTVSGKVVIAVQASLPPGFTLSLSVLFGGATIFSMPNVSAAVGLVCPSSAKFILFAFDIPTDLVTKPIAPPGGLVQAVVCASSPVTTKSATVLGTEPASFLNVIVS